MVNSSKVETKVSKDLVQAELKESGHIRVQCKQSIPPTKTSREDNMNSTFTISFEIDLVSH